VFPALTEHEVRVAPRGLGCLAHLHLEGVVVLALSQECRGACYNFVIMFAPRVGK
jgi:hypothetical protein